VRLKPARVEAPLVVGEERELLERLIGCERQIADLRAREARMREAVAWAAMTAKGLSLDAVAEMLEALLFDQGGSRGG
jgi:hypothetical protein